MDVWTPPSCLSSVPTGLWIGGEERDGVVDVRRAQPRDRRGADLHRQRHRRGRHRRARRGRCRAGRVGRHRRRGSAARSCARCSRRSPPAPRTFATLMTLEMGKVLAESMGEVKYGAEFFRWFAEEAVRIGGRYTREPRGQRAASSSPSRPVGPCLAITPWNFPLAMGTRKIGPAMAAGCTMIVKPAQETPLTMLLLAKLMDEAGLPKGVLSVLPTTKPGDADHRADRRRPAAQADLHRLDRRGQGAGQAELRQAAAAVDGTGRQRAVHRVRRRRRRRRGRGRDAGQDAQRRRGLHRGQPVPRRQRGARGVHREAGRSG